MANWCTGILKIRGNKENTLRFIKEGIREMGDNPLRIKRDDKYVIEFEKSEFYIKDTRRGFLFIDGGEIWHDFDDNEEEKVTVLGESRFAWGVDVYALRRLSEEFQVDIKLYAFERGMCFNEDIEIIKGEITKNETIKFDDYDWDCVNPTIGG